MTRNGYQHMVLEYYVGRLRALRAWDGIRAFDYLLTAQKSIHPRRTDGQS